MLISCHGDHEIHLTGVCILCTTEQSGGGGSHQSEVTEQSRASKSVDKTPLFPGQSSATHFCTQWTIGPLGLDSLSSDSADSSDLHLPQNRNATRYSAEN